MTWQPIETAPKDGRVILAWSPKWDEPDTAFWATRDGRSGWHIPYVFPTQQPTHWMPLPAPPLLSKEIC